MYSFTLFLLSWARLLLPMLFPATAAEKEKTHAPAVKKMAIEHVSWSTGRRLTWEDFKGLPDEINPHHALTAANLAVNASCQSNVFTYEVTCVFLPTESWSKNKISQKLLEHEQLHFDLTEVHARLLRKELQQLDCSNQKQRLKATVTSAFAKWKAEQDAFDAACKHGVDIEEQAIWAAGISQRLQELEMYQQVYN